MNDETAEVLSASGRARREAMLIELTAELRRTHRARRRRRRTVSLAALAILGVVLARVTLVETPDAAPIDRVAQQTPPPKDAIASPLGSATCSIVLIETDPTIVERLRAGPTGHPTILDDRALLDTLVAIGRPAGLMRMDGRTRLTAAVTDEQLRRPQ